ncbi:alpha-L-rhamnosidase [Posidoniimonas corsicana]|uniref:alpha-L-rhamnosidase n=1 Tax=Posidoniimonas corsicana TaxID=1938618 RepID=UPI001E616359|nr:alpha-L-rhamnosidase [Posidoniimonas corsicana]
MFPGSAVAELTASRLRCESLETPSGVDRAAPQLSWIVESPQPNQSQSAYRILVATREEKLAADDGDLWDSGKVSSAETYAIQYKGKPLQSHQQCHWKVMAWDATGQPGEWSDASEWTVGLLNQEDWQGEWIGYDKDRQPLADPPAIDLDGARWVRHAADPDVPPAQTRDYRCAWQLPADIDLRTATLAIMCDDHARVEINGTTAVSGVSIGTPKVEEVLGYLRPGKNEFRVVCRNGQPGPTGICLKVTAEGHDGQVYVLTTDDRWTSSAAADQPQHQVTVVGPFGCKPWGRPAYRRDLTSPPVYLRDEFVLDKPVRRATAYFSSLGWADFSINGSPVKSDFFSSGWTDYRQRVYYRSYDATNLVRQGDNAWGLVLADGWYSGHVAWGMQRGHYGEKPRVRAMLRVEFQDGQTQTFATDDSWRASTAGPKRVADPLIGEEYDATQEMPGWDAPGFSAPGWKPVDVGAEVQPLIQWHPGPAVIEVDRFPAKSISEPAPGVYVYDLGQNFAGVVQLKVRGRAGQRVRLRFAERLNPDGTVYTDNLRMARATDIYTCSGDGEETWTPTQTFHGFQYVELTGLDEPTQDAVTGIALSSNTPLVSSFECSDPALNRLYKNVLWTQLANFIDVPTDCPQRDERLGWTGDAQVYVHTACLTTNVQAFFRKWLVDLVDAQEPNGQFPKVAPVVAGQSDGGPAWSEAGVICPWEIYSVYNDRKLLEQQYPAMVRYVEFCRNRSRDGVLPPERFHCFGDWLSVNANTPNEIIYTAYYARSADIVSKAAEALGRTGDASKYRELFQQIKQAFNDEYVSADGRIHGDTQCCYVLALGYGLLDGQAYEHASRHLIDDIRSRGWKLSTGFVGTKDLMMVLSQIGRHDVALRLLHQQEYPGWLFSIGHGATSIWERWDGWTPDGGFQDPGMNSFAHYSFGAVYGWMAENLGGIRAGRPGFETVIIEPTFDPHLDFCRVTYDSLHGPIKSEWSRADGARRLQVTIPANTRATVRLRGVTVDQLRVNGQNSDMTDFEAADAVDRFPNSGDDAQTEVRTAELLLPSGDYLLEMPGREA